MHLGQLADGSRFNPAEHIRTILEGAWLEMVDERGEPLLGIRGRAGVAAPTQAGLEIGLDLIELQPGSAFPPHVHSGEHLLYVLSGEGLAHIDGADHRITMGEVIFIAAHYPHSVSNPADAPAPLRLLTVGYPHKPVSARDRMRTLAPHHHGDAGQV